MSNIEESLLLVEVQIDESAASSQSSRSSRSKHFMILASTISIALIIFGFSSNTHVRSVVNTQLRSLLELTVSGEPMPVPFWIIRQDVPDAMKVQNAFYNFYELRDKKATLEDGSTKYETTFFEGVKMIKDGVTTSLGYFNPLSPKGLPSNEFIFEYGDKCVETNDYREGKVTLICGDELAMLSIKEIKPCRYDIVATSPIVCSPKESFPYLKGSSIDASDNGWWEYKINFFKHGDAASPVYQFHSDGAHSERFLLGTITNSLDASGDIKFTNGDVCDVTGQPRSGLIHLECGCGYEIADLTETSVCVYDIIVKHPQACAYAPSNCDKMNLRAEAVAKKRQMVHIDKPNWDEIYSSRMSESAFPRDLLNAKYTSK